MAFFLLGNVTHSSAGGAAGFGLGLLAIGIDLGATTGAGAGTGGGAELPLAEATLLQFPPLALTTEAVGLPHAGLPLIVAELSATVRRALQLSSSAALFGGDDGVVAVPHTARLGSAFARLEFRGLKLNGVVN